MRTTSELEQAIRTETAGGTAPPGLGIPAYEAQPLLQQDSFKELVNKLAWVLGSTYRVPYNNVRTEARVWAMALAKITIVEHGYPLQIRIP